MPVYLVGAGPGDPELITLKGLRMIKSADVVVYDALIATELLAHAKPDAELIYAGKRAGKHGKRQEEINALLLEKSTDNRCVVRLKGGDPFIFGRGGEEVSFLLNHQIPFEVIPGISSANGIGAAIGLPLTDRRYASQVVFVSACHETSEKSSNDWQMLARFPGTVVIYMGVLRLGLIVKRLLENEMRKTMPISIIQNGTMADQRVLTSTLVKVVAEAKKEAIAPPALIIIGKVNALRQMICDATINENLNNKMV